MLNLNWGIWAYGLVAAIITGAAGALITATGASLVLPNDVNTGAGLHNLLWLTGITAVFHGIVGAAAYLQKQPLPEIVKTTVDQTKTLNIPGEPQIVSKVVTETTKEVKQ